MARDARPDAMAELVEGLATDGRIRHVRDAEYFAWRFRNPLHEYRSCTRGTRRLTGYLALRRARSERFDRVGVYLADWEAGDIRTKQALLDAAIRWGGFSHMVAWSATLPDDTRRLLHEAGFVVAGLPARGLPCVLARPCAPASRQGNGPWPGGRCWTWRTGTCECSTRCRADWRPSCRRRRMGR